MELKVINWNKEDVGTASVADGVLDVVPQPSTIHKVVLWQLAKRRNAVASVKDRSEVAGSTKKIYRQKGTGRARHSSKKANIFRSGGVTFGPVTRDFGFKVNKKERKLALRMALSDKMQSGKIFLLDKLAIDGVKTATLKQHLENLGIGSALIVDAQAINESIRLSAANLKHIDTLPVVGLNVLDILKHDSLIVSTDGIKAIEERLK